MAYGRSAPRQFHLLHEYKRNIGGMGFFPESKALLEPDNIEQARERPVG